jgi:hypothetical protein
LKSVWQAVSLRSAFAALLLAPVAAVHAAEPAPGSIAPHVPLQDKTLVAWVTLANLSQRGGSVLAIDDRAKHFDAIGQELGSGNIFFPFDEKRS